MPLQARERPNGDQPGVAKSALYNLNSAKPEIFELREGPQCRIEIVVQLTIPKAFKEDPENEAFYMALAALIDVDTAWITGKIFHDGENEHINKPIYGADYRIFHVDKLGSGSNHMVNHRNTVEGGKIW